MSRRTRFSWFLVAPVLLFSTALATAQTKPGVQTPLTPPSQAGTIIDQLLKQGKIMRASQAKRGMRGIGRSVFQGTAIEEFPIEVLGTLERVNGGGDIVMIRVLGGTVVKRQSGIIAGMSGSPVYINGKMLGAIALGWNFPREPIAGVTPITEMIETSLPDPEKTQAVPTPAKPTVTTEQLYRPRSALKLAGNEVKQVIVSRDPHRIALAGPSTDAVITLRPANTLMQISGFGEAALPRLRKMFEPYGIQPVIGPSSKKTGVNPPFRPGGALGVQFISGDMDATAVGTITFRWGNRILAFGHPMFGKGAVSVPMTTAYVHDIFPSVMESFKLASPVKIVGALQQDNLYAVGGTVGMTADMVPMNIHIANPERHINKTFKVQIIKDPLFTPGLVQEVAMQALNTTLGMDSDKMVRVNMTTELENGPSIVRSNYVYAQDLALYGALGDLMEAVMITQMNSFQRGAIKLVKLEVALEAERHTARIRKLFADRNKVKAGESLNVNVVLEPTTDPDHVITRSFKIAVPADAPAGALRVAVGNGTAYWPLTMVVGAAPPDPNNLTELLQAYNKTGAENDLLLVASTPNAYWMVDRKKLSSPPPSWAKLVRPDTSSAVGIYNEIQLQKEVTGFDLSGVQFLSIPVESARHSDQTPPDNPGGAAATARPGASSLAELDSSTALAAAGDDSDGINSNVDTNEYAWHRVAPRVYNRLFNYTPAWPDSPLLEQMRLIWKQLGTATPLAETPVAAPPPIVPVRAPAAAATPTPTVAADAATTDSQVTPATEADNNIARPALRWVQNTSADFARGLFDSTMVTDSGNVQLAPAAKLLAATVDPLAWSVTADSRGNTYIGTGNDARLYRIDGTGNLTTLYDGKEVAITALTSDSAGNVYAGMAPGGRVYRFAPDGTKTILLDTEQAFVWSLVWDAKGRLLVGTGGERGALYSVDAAAANAGSGTAKLVTVPEAHVRAVAVRGSDIFLGTGGAQGVLYRYDTATGALKALYQITESATRSGIDRAGMSGVGEEGMPPGAPMGGPSMPGRGRSMMVMAGGGDERTMAMLSRMMGQQVPGSEILAVAAAPEGIYFGTSNRGTLYRWTAEAGVREVFTTAAQSIYALRRAADGRLYAATGDKGYVYQITPGATQSESHAARLLEPAQLQSLALDLTPSGDLVVGTGNNAAAYRISLAPAANGVYSSNVLDAKNVVRWGTVRVQGAGYAFETRSGNTLEPDATWSDWQPPVTNQFGEMSVASPPARYLQYRARLIQSGASAKPTLSRVEIIFRPKNQAPTVGITAPTGGEYWHAKKSVTWNGQDADRDQLRYKLSLSNDNGATWKPIELKTPTTASQELDTSKWSDGTYRLKVEASDAGRNPEDPQMATDISEPFTIDNAAPRIDNPTVERVAGAGDNGPWQLRLTATDALSPLSGAEWRIVPPKKAEATPEVKATPPAAQPLSPSPISPAATDKKKDAKADKTTKPSTTPTPAPTATPAAKESDKDDEDATEKLISAVKDAMKTDDGTKTTAAKQEWQAAAATDGIFDSRSEEIVSTIDPALLMQTGTLQKGTQIEIRVRDAAGNSATVTVTLP